MCFSAAGVKTNDHYLLRCQNVALARSSFLNRTFEINVKSWRYNMAEFRNMNDLTPASLLLFSSEKKTFDIKTKILNLTRNTANFSNRC